FHISYKPQIVSDLHVKSKVTTAPSLLLSPGVSPPSLFLGGLHMSLMSDWVIQASVADLQATVISKQGQLEELQGCQLRAQLLCVGIDQQFSFLSICGIRYKKLASCAAITCLVSHYPKGVSTLIYGDCMLFIIFALLSLRETKGMEFAGGANLASISTCNKGFYLFHLLPHFRHPKSSPREAQQGAA
ncbi:hypothetical protein M8C21_000860, partial [Ambrosia artemisiifolia]